MELARKPETRRGFSPEFKRELIEKIVVMDLTLGDLAEELGIPRQVMSKWALMVERAETTASMFGEPFVPATRVVELERDIEVLKLQLDYQASTIEILQKKRSL